MADRILMIEDEPGLVLTVGDRLKAEGYIFDSRTDGVSGEEAASNGKWSAIILDVMLPGKDGFAVCRSLRTSGVKTPILMLTARSQTEDRVQGLKIGADDYLSKPFEMPELIARIEALIRRSSQRHGNAQAADCEEVSIDLKRGVICNKGEETTLSAQEIKLLDYFYKHRDVIISREELLNTVWGYDSNITTRTIDVHVARLRQKMGDVRDIPRYIHTVRGIGYKFTPPN
ncbi:response regulator transcription factor [Treponema zuelzerae]|uniref:Phosphate regulon transcriptional regulatory protein PhoB n=1 Tax=Teretinema zuelzerae TaxID=156 RepID=A0AAE3JIS5_9SPIR|nr:response regulator transcription factor [Teretinema zuelzerae]MCD1655572.1 response regulator transcription factor [Teretinema zuelzerae]HPO02593.1 response regulator transcription factor [Treponemataceae bacterium]